MAIDRPDDDSARPERQVPVGGLGVDVPAARSGHSWEIYGDPTPDPAHTLRRWSCTS